MGISLLRLMKDDIKIAQGKGNKFLTPEQVEEVKNRKTKIERFEGGLPGNRKWRRQFRKMNKGKFA